MDGPVAVSEIKGLAGDRISWPTVKRAKAQLGVKARKGGFEGGWVWELPEPNAPESDPTNGRMGKVRFNDRRYQRASQGEVADLPGKYISRFT